VSRRAATVVIVLIAAALLGVAALAIPSSPLHDKATLGLDLQGGLEVTLQAVPPKDRDLTDEDLDRSVEIMRDRVDKLGVAEPEIRKQGDDQIVIQLPGVSDPEAAAQVIGKTAQLELYDLQANLVSPSIDVQRFPVATDSIYKLLAGQQALVEPANAESWYLFNKQNRLVAGPAASREELLRGRGGDVPDGWSVLATPPKTVVVSCGIDEVVCPGVQESPPTKDYFYLMRYDPPAVPEMTGADLELSGTRSDFDPQTSQPIVTLAFTDSGADKFEEITREEAQRGKLLSNTVGQGQKIEQNFAIVLDREIKSWPSIDWELYPGGISGNNGAQITGLGDVGEANDLALVLQTGALPVRFETLDQTAISATLGKDSLAEAKQALIVGLILVAVFLLVFYRFLGLIAVVGLGIYAALLYAAILLFNVTLTLPGIAGLVLTLGVAADANVVIFERVKEEARAGRSVRAAISAGYTKGFATIVDANVVTMITALVLFAVATASVRGFALMLLIGTAISMLTAVLATRALLSLLGSFSWIESPKLMGASGGGIPRWLKFDYIGRRRIWFGLSAAIVVISIVALGVRGLNLGIDFEGGTQVNFRTTQPVALEDVRAEAAEIGQADAVIQGRGTPVDGKYSNFQIRTESLDRGQIESLSDGLETSIGATSFGVKNVSESFGRQIANSALLAIFVSLLLICAYISLRFQWKFAVPVIVAMLHDILITIGIYSLVGREVTTATVAAILTVLGYSIYDTIIIFDRIRENTPLLRRASFRVIGNVSLWEVIPRSLATTFITLLPIASLYLLGGDTLKDFAFALLVGIGAGAYSSIFLAAPLLAWIKEREPEFARRKDDDTALAGMQTVGGVLDDEGEALSADDAILVQEAEELLVPDAPSSISPEPAPAPAGAGAAASSKRERRRQRRSGRPHGRSR
jgi:SecD/SecF fusion protein